MYHTKKEITYANTRTLSTSKAKKLLGYDLNGQ